MAVAIQVTRFQKITGGGPAQDVALNFTPKAIILLSEGSASDNTFTDHFQTIIGFSDGTNQAATASVSRDNVADSSTARVHRNNAVFVRLTETAPTTEADVATVTFGTNKITLTWSTLSATAVYIGLIAIAGDDITNCKVNTVDIGTTSTGNADYTGLGFTPTAPNGILFTMAADITTINTPATGAAISLNAGISSTQRIGYGSASEEARATSDNWRYASITKCLLNLDNTTGAVDYDADFVDWITDGFRLNITDAAGGTTEKFSYLAIKGGTWDIGTETGRLTVGTKTTTVAANSQTLRGLMTFAHEFVIASWGAPATNGRMHMGMSDGTNEFSMVASDSDAANTMISVRRNSFTNRVMNVISPNATAASSTDFLNADFDSFSTNSFTLNHTVVQASSDVRVFGWLIVADFPVADVAAEPPRSQSYGTVKSFDNNMGPTIFG